MGIGEVGVGLGGPTKYNEEVHEKIVELAGKGVPKAAISRACRLGSETLYDWLRKGRTNPEEYPHFAQLLLDFEEAQANLEARMVEKISETATGFSDDNWRAGMAFLERRNAKDWGRKDEVRMDAPQALPQINILVLNDPDARRAHQDLLRSVDSSSAGLAIGPGVDSEREDDA